MRLSRSLWLFAACALPAAPAHAQDHAIEVLALQGEAAPGTAATYGGFHPPIAVSDGGFAFVAELDASPDFEGIFADVGAGIVPVALEGAPDPLPGCDSLAGVQRPVMNASGRVLFLGTCVQGEAYAEGLFLWDAGVLSAVLLAGDAFPGEARYLALVSDFAMNDAGDIVFAGSTTDAYPFGTHQGGLFRVSGGVPGVLVLEHDTEVTVPGGTAQANALGGVAIDPAGRVAFVASLTGDHDGGAVLRWVDGEIETLLLSSDALPGTGGGTAPFNVGHRLTMDAQGRVSFRASVVGGSGVGGIFRLSTEGHEPIALEGQAAPGAAGSYDHLFVQPAMSADGRVAFAAVLSGGASGSAFFAGDGVHTRTVAASLDPLPGTGGGYLAQAQGPIGVSPNGRIGFEGIIFSGSANRGLFLATPPAPPAVPALPPFAAAALVLGLAGWGARLRRRVGRRSPSARPASCR